MIVAPASADDKDCLNAHRPLQPSGRHGSASGCTHADRPPLSFRYLRRYQDVSVYVRQGEANLLLYIAQSQRTPWPLGEREEGAPALRVHLSRRLKPLELPALQGCESTDLATETIVCIT